MEHIVAKQPQKINRYFVLIFLLGHIKIWLLQNEKDIIYILAVVI